MSSSWSIQPTDLATLALSAGEPVLVRSEVGVPVGSAGELESVAVMHVLFDTPVDAFERTLRTVEEQDDVLPRLEVSKVLCSYGNPMEYARVQQMLSFKLLFFGNDYEYVLHYFFEKSAQNEFLVWWQLAESLDGQIQDTDGIWYFKEVLVNETEYTYVSYATHTVFLEKKVGQQAAIERFGERDLRNALLALDEAAQRRIQ